MTMMIFMPELALASGSGEALKPLDFTSSYYGFIALGVFIFSYMLVIGEESIHMRKSKPVIVAAGIVWVLVALAYSASDQSAMVHEFLNHNLLEYVNLLLFLLAAMTYINTLEERQVFAALRGWLVSRGYGFRKIFIKSHFNRGMSTDILYI
jgi:Na+/H+ antiporter NhaD/arsenite permease-like protein